MRFAKAAAAVVLCLLALIASIAAGTAVGFWLGTL